MKDKEKNAALTEEKAEKQKDKAPAREKAGKRKLLVLIVLACLAVACLVFVFCGPAKALTPADGPDVRTALQAR